VKVSVRHLLPILCVVATLGCKGEEGINPAPLGVTPDFEPGAATPGGGSVSLQKGPIDGERITLDVVVTDVSEPISGIAMKLDFPGDIALFEGCSDGDLLPPGNCYVSPSPLRADEVFIGRTIVNPQQPVPAAGARTILKLRFLVFGVCDVCSPNVAFVAPNLGGGDSTALLDAQGDPILVNWYAGTLSGQ
jgi:hypothetical protein